MDIEQTIERLRAKLRSVGTPERASQEKRYLKSDLIFLGVTVPMIRQEVQRFARAHPELDRRALLSLVDALWSTGVHELRSFAVFLLVRYVEALEPSDCDFVMERLRSARTWAHVDELATKVLGSLVERFAEVRRKLPRWARDDDFWVRRAALLSLLDALREGSGDFALFERLAIPLLEEREFFIRKAIGWVLREVSKKRPALVAGFVERHRERMSGLTLREASKYLK